MNEEGGTLAARKYPCEALLRGEPYERTIVDLNSAEDLKKFKSEEWKVDKYWYEE